MTWSATSSCVFGFLNPIGTSGSDLPQTLDRYVLRVLGPMTAGLAVVFALFSVFNALDELPEAARAPIMGTDVVTVGLLVALSIALARGRVRARWANPLALSVVAVALINILVAFATTREPFYLSYLLILIVACSALMLSLPWLMLSLGLTWVSSAAFAWALLSREDFHHYAITVLAASALGVIVFVARLRAVLRTETALDAAIEEAARRREAEEALRGGEERLQLAIEGSCGGWWDIAMDPEQPDVMPDECYLSPSLKAFIGYREDQFPNSLAAWRGRIHPPDLERVKKSASDHLMGLTKVQECQYRIRHKDGSLRWIDVRGRIHRALDGSPIRWSGINWDITARKEAEAHLNKLSYAIEQSPSLVIITDVEGRIEYVNRKFTETTGYAVNDVVGKSPRFLDFGETTETSDDELWKTILAGGEWHGEFKSRKKNGEACWVFSSVSPIRDAEGVTRNFLLVQEDITERKRIETRLIQSQKLETVGQLVSGVAHDFNNLLTAVIGFAELASKRVDPEDPISEDLLEIKRAGESAGALTRQLLAFSRQQVLRPRVLSLNEVLVGVEELLRRTISEDIELEMHLEPDLGHVRVDPTQMEQILINLAINGRDAMPGGGRLTIETSNRKLAPDDVGGHVSGRAGAFVQLAVSDSGCGMDAATRERIFEPFFTTKRSGDGTGLGLSTVYGTVKQSDGFIWVYSEPGLGSTFKIYLPRIDEAAESISRRPVLAGEMQGTETILLVEDHEAVCRAAASALERNGYEVIAVKDPVQALEVPTTRKVDLLLSDIVMPGLNGVSLAEQIRKDHPEMKLVLMSGYSRAAARQTLAMDSDTRYLSKPFRLDELLSTVREALES